MPAYPFLIFLARLVTFRLLSDALLAQFLGYLSWVGGLLLARATLERVAPEAARLGLLLFGLFPLLGVWSAANPVADLLAYVAVLAALLFAIQNRSGAFTCATAAGLLVHQAFYPSYAVLVLTCLARGMRWCYLVAAAAPFILYYVAIAVQKNDPNWILSYHLLTHSPQHGALPLFDGIIGTFLQGSAKATVKATILATSFVTAIALSFYCWRGKHWLLLALSLPVVLAGVFSTQHDAWVIFRLTKLLVLPASSWLMNRPRLLRALNALGVYISIAGLLAVSQITWAYYSTVYANW
jgi:hypothetical protein